jgi:hypothetical protein
MQTRIGTVVIHLSTEGTLHRVWAIEDGDTPAYSGSFTRQSVAEVVFARLVRSAQDYLALCEEERRKTEDTAKRLGL